MKKILLALAMAALGLAMIGGCTGAETTATKEEEQAFRNPPKEPPAEMAQGMEEAMRKAEEARQSGQTETR